MRCLLAAGLALTLAAGAAHAQQPLVADALPDSVAERAIAIYNRDGTLRLNAASEIAAGTRIEGAVAALHGPLRIAGSVAGDVVVINGDVDLQPTAQVSGDVLVVGGSIARPPGARVEGALHSYREPLRFRFDDGRLVYVPPHLERGLSAGREWRFGRADVFIGAHDSYNRVEGLPIAFGPRLRLGGSNPTRLQALAVYRTATGFRFDPDDMGYDVSAGQQLGVRGFSVEARLYSEVAPIEAWNVTDRESSLATFLLHRDYRDHYERTGWAAGLHLARPGRPLSLALWYRDEDHAPVTPRDPFTLFYPDEPWRLEPEVAQGRLQTISLEWRYDTRNDPADPSFGWLIRGTLEQGIGGTLALPDTLPGSRTARTGFNDLHLDVRRYLRLSPYAQLALRGFVAGSLDGRALPPQRQHALGAEGSLPAFGLLEFDCGAREAPTTERRAFAWYGCDRVALVQLEYQAGFPIARRLFERLGIAARFSNAIRWAAFFDAGRAWTEPDARDGRGGGLSDFAADAGLGLRVGPLGAYWAIPLSGTEKPLNFFVRVGTQL